MKGLIRLMLHMRLTDFFTNRTIRSRLLVLRHAIAGPDTRVHLNRLASSTKTLTAFSAAFGKASSFNSRRRNTLAVNVLPRRMHPPWQTAAADRMLQRPELPVDELSKGIRALIGLVGDLSHGLDPCQKPDAADQNQPRPGSGRRQVPAKTAIRCCWRLVV